MNANLDKGIGRRRFGGLAAAGAAAMTLVGGLRSAVAEDGVDVPWASTDPHLSGNFKPVQRETNAADLVVTAGRVPADLQGAYMRNGPNPLFQPIGFAYPMDGDGMVHAVYFNNGRARYRNRFVRTNDLAVEQRAGHAVYGSFTHPVAVDRALLRPGDNPGPFKNGAFINVIRHGGLLLALNEATTCYALTPELETLGQWKAGTDQPIRLGAHNRHHPRTGAMIALEYSWREPIVRFHHIDASGRLVNTIPVEMPMPTMVHDFVLTERYIVLVAGPAVFDIEAARVGQSMLQWRPSLGLRIAVVPLDGGATTWIEGDPLFAYHYANGFERGDKIVIDYAHHDRFALSGPAPAPSFKRMVIDLPTRSVTVSAFSDVVVEFPRVNDRREALPTRYAFMPTVTDTLTIPNPPAATFNTMLRFDTETGAMRRHDFGNRIVGEGAFIPKPGAQGEDDGYVAAFVYDPQRDGSDLVLLDAARIDDAPVAVIALPQRVPQGLHGNWIPAV